MFIDARFLQLQKALLPIDVIFDVIFTVFKLMHPKNVKLLINDTPDGIVLCQSGNFKYCFFFFRTFNLFLQNILHLSRE